MARPKLQLVFTDVDDRYEPMSLLGTRLYENRVPIDGLVNPHPELTSPIAMSRYRLSYLAASLSYRNPDSATGARYLVLEHDPGLGAALTWPPPQLDPTQRINTAVRHNAHDGWPAGNFDKKLVIEGGKLNEEDAASRHE
ncbi:hypothetical protein LRP88_03580 [Fusarium phalaenopsidis]|nr:hypothetical protein NCS56_01037100 [Fusarium sp. Ph1]